jgi:site-specific recombinase XerD
VSRTTAEVVAERPRPLPELAAELLETIDIARNTETTYRNGLHVFAEFVLGDSEAPLAPISGLQEDSLVQLRHWMRQSKGYNRRTENTYLAATIRYLEWLDARSQLPAGLSSARMKLVLKQSRGRRRVGYKTQPIKDAVPLLIRYYEELPLPDPATPRGLRKFLEILRNRAVVHTLFATGMRADEICSLRRSSCDDGRATRLTIVGKGDKERMVLLNAEAQKALETYLIARETDTRKPSADEPLFVRHDGAKAVKGIGRKTVWLLVHQAAEAVAGKAAVSPHDFRRYIATTLLSEGMPLESVQEFLGHESIVTTRTVYARTRNEVLEDQVATFRPTPAAAAAMAERAKKGAGPRNKG